MLIPNEDLIEGQIYKATNGYSLYRYIPRNSYLKCLIVETWTFQNLTSSDSPNLETTQDEKDWYNYCESVNCIPFALFLQKKSTTSTPIQLYPLT